MGFRLAPAKPNQPHIIVSKLARAQQLIQLDRCEDGARLLIEHLGEHPQDGPAHSLLALASSSLELWHEAEGHGKEGVRLEPTSSFAWYVLGEVALNRGHPDRAAEAAERAIEFAPGDAGGFSLLARAHIARKRWADGLRAADLGLELDPVDRSCTNIRALALRQLGRKEEASEALRGQIARSPEDAMTHANAGWSALHGRDYDQAQEHFREALRLDPNHQWAREGVLEALRARHWFYRPVLAYSLWMSRLRGQAQAGLLFGAWLGFRGLSKLSEIDTPIAPVFSVLIVVYFVFVALSWFAVPVANALLLVHPLGRLALSRWDQWGGVIIGSLLVLACAFLLSASSSAAPLFSAGFLLVVWCACLTTAYKSDEPQVRRGMAMYCVGVGLLGGAALWIQHGVRAEIAALQPFVERSEIHKQEMQALDLARTEALEDGPEIDEERLADLVGQIADWKARDTALAQEMDDPAFTQRIEGLKQKRERSDTLALGFVLLSMVVSQFVAAGLEGRAARN